MAAILRRAFIGAALAWTVLLVAVPFIASRSHATPLGTAIVIAVYAIGSFVCHQLPERSWRLWTAQMPVCARCAGIYGGAAFAALTAAARGFQPSVDVQVDGRRSPARLALRRRRLAVVAAALPSVATLVYEWATGITPSNALRFAAGIPIGVVVAWLVVSAAENQVN
jgi:uncharacterized membrane protein